MPTGTVKFFNERNGYGFIAPDEGGNDAFVHMTAVERAGMRTLRENQRLSYELEQDQRGKYKAVNLQSADDAPAAAETPAAAAPEAAAAQPETASAEVTEVAEVADVAEAEEAPPPAS
jgi:CspA family cold shock protein